MSKYARQSSHADLLFTRDSWWVADVLYLLAFGVCGALFGALFGAAAVALGVDVSILFCVGVGSGSFIGTVLSRRFLG